MILIRERSRQPGRQFRIREDPGRSPPLNDDAMQVGNAVQFGRVTNGIHEFDDELTHFRSREMPNPGKDLRKDEQDGASKRGPTLCGDG